MNLYCSLDTCGRIFWREKGSRQAYCTDRCQNRAKHARRTGYVRVRAPKPPSAPRVCAHAPCGNVVPPVAHANFHYCSQACYADARRQRDKERRRKPKPAIRPCAFSGCNDVLAPDAPFRAIYCSDACRYEARLESNRRTYQRNRDAYNAAEREKRRINGQPPRAPRKAAKRAVFEQVPPPQLHPTARRCFGCRHMRMNPAAWNGVECSAGLFVACNPLAPAGPRLKEAS